MCAFLENVFIEGSAGAVLDSAAGTPNSQAVTVQGNASGVPIPVTGTFTPPTGTQTVIVAGTSTVEVAGIVGTSTVTVAGTSTVEVAGIVGTSTVAVAGIVQVAPTAAANTRLNPFFNEITDGTNVMGTMVAFGSNPGTALALNVNAAVQEGTVAIAGTSTVEVAGILGTSTVEVAGIVGTSTVTVAGTVTVAATGTQTVTVVGTSTVEVAGIVGTSTVVVAGTTTISGAGPVAAGVAASSSVLSGLVVATSAPTATAGQQIAQQGDPKGNHRVTPYGSTGSFQSQVSAAISNVANTVTNLLTVPAATKWVFQGCRCNLVTSSTVATRQFQLVVSDASGNVMMSVQAVGTQAANLSEDYAFGNGLPSAATVNGVSLNPFPNMCLGPGMTISMFITNGVATDTCAISANVIALPD